MLIADKTYYKSFNLVETLSAALCDLPRHSARLADGRWLLFMTDAEP
jgi:hypothetical protein